MNDSRNVTPPILAVLIGSLAASGLALAEAPVPPAGNALEKGQRHDGPRLTGKALQECVRLSVRIEDIDYELLALKGPLDSAESDHEHQARWLDRSAESLDRTDEAALAAYNKAIDAHSDAVQRYNDLLPAYNEVAARQASAVAAFNRDCTRLPYYRQEWVDAIGDLYLEKAAASE